MRELEDIPSVLPWSSSYLTVDWNKCRQSQDGEVIISSRLQESTQETVKISAWKMNHFPPNLHNKRGINTDRKSTRAEAFGTQQEMLWYSSISLKD